MSLAPEREPVLVATMTLPLDGQDDPQRSLENVRMLLDGALKEIQGFGAIRGYDLEVVRS